MIRKFYLICFLFVPILNAQFNRFELGVESGPALGKFWTPNTPNSFYTMHTGYYTGTFFRYNPLPFFGIQSGIYSERVSTQDRVAFTNNENKMVGTGEVMVNTDFITFPLITKFRVGNRLKVNFSVGTFFSYMLQHSVTVRYGNTSPYGDHTVDYANMMNRFNTGLLLGAGIDYVFFRHLNLGFEVRDQLGLYNLSKNDQNYFRTNSLQFLLRISWQFR
jgi:hypothetical protein